MIDETLQTSSVKEEGVKTQFIFNEDLFTKEELESDPSIESDLQRLIRFYQSDDGGNLDEFQSTKKAVTAYEDYLNDKSKSENSSPSIALRREQTEEEEEKPDSKNETSGTVVPAEYEKRLGNIISNIDTDDTSISVTDIIIKTNGLLDKENAYIGDDFQTAYETLMQRIEDLYPIYSSNGNDNYLNALSALKARIQYQYEGIQNYLSQIRNFEKDESGKEASNLINQTNSLIKEFKPPYTIERMNEIVDALDVLNHNNEYLAVIRNSSYMNELFTGVLTLSSYLYGISISDNYYAGEGLSDDLNQVANDLLLIPGVKENLNDMISRLQNLDTDSQVLKDLSNHIKYKDYYLDELLAYLNEIRKNTDTQRDTDQDKSK